MCQSRVSSMVGIGAISKTPSKMGLEQIRSIRIARSATEQPWYPQLPPETCASTQTCTIRRLEFWAWFLSVISRCLMSTHATSSELSDAYGKHPRVANSNLIHGTVGLLKGYFICRIFYIQYASCNNVTNQFLDIRRPWYFHRVTESPRELKYGRSFWTQR